MIFVDTNIFYNILYKTELTPKANRAIELLIKPVISVIVYNELLHVPFIIKYPIKKGLIKRVNSRVSLIDLMPTILKISKDFLSRQ